MTINLHFTVFNHKCLILMEGDLKFVRSPRPQPRFRFSPLPLFLSVSHGDDVEVDAAAVWGGRFSNPLSQAIERPFEPDGTTLNAAKDVLSLLQSDHGTLQQTSVDFIWVVPLCAGKIRESVLLEDRFFFFMGLIVASLSCLPITLDFGECVLQSLNFRECVLLPLDFRECGDGRTHFRGQVLFKKDVLREDANF